MRRRWWVVGVLVAVLVAGLVLFGRGPVGGMVAAARLPDQEAPEVARERERLTRIAVNHMWTDPAHTRCSVRVLRQEAQTSWAQASCVGPQRTSAPGGGDRFEGAANFPMRVDGEAVQVPGDGSLFEADVRRLFPADLAEAVLAGFIRPPDAPGTPRP